MRCPECNKFVSYDDNPECDIQSVEVDNETVTASVTVTLNCGDCGTALKNAEIETQEDIKHQCKPGAVIDPDWKEGGDQFESEEEGSADGYDRLETKDRHGKAIKSTRYMKKYYGFTLATKVKCLGCSEVFEVNLKGEEQASGFDECC